MARELRNLTRLIYLGFALVIVSSAYWGVFQHQGLLQRRDNPRRVFADQNFARGLIVDRHGIALAVTSPRAGTRYPQRNYPYAEVVGALGYYSYQYGAAGLELAFDDVLVGAWGPRPNSWQFLQNEFLNHPLIGYDLRSTLDLWLQLELTERFGEQGGAAVVIELPSGAVRAMVSLPSVNPNALDLNWPQLEKNQKQQSPLVNRVLNFTYQPGGILQPLLLMAMLNDGYHLDQRVVSSQQPILINGFSVDCLQAQPPTLTLAEAFIAGCPEPFATYTGLRWSLFEQAGFFEPVSLTRIPTLVTLPPRPYDLRLEALGQGQLTVTPLQVARLTVAIANQGQTIDFYMADAYRVPDARVWRPLPITPNHEALLPAEWVAAIRDVLAASARKMPVMAGQFGHAAMAYAGDQMLSWYLGFTEWENGQAWVVVVVVENAQAPYDAAAVAQGAFEYGLSLAE